MTNPYYESYRVESSSDSLEHYGVLGMKWGVRRYQNADGTLTTAGKRRYKNDTPEQIERSERRKAKVVKGATIAGKVGVSIAASLAIAYISPKIATVGYTAIRDLLDSYGSAPVPTLSSPNGKILTEHILRENIIYENVIPEKRIRENIIR